MNAVRRTEIERGIEILSAKGVCWADWARGLNLSIHAVRAVRRGRSRCSRGDAYIAGRELARIGEIDMQALGQSGVDAACRLREALEECERVLSGLLASELADLDDLGPGPAVVCELRDPAEAMDRVTGINAALQGARAALGGRG